MTGMYLASAFILAALLFFNRNRVVNYLLVIGFLFVQCGFTVYEYLHLNETELHYFTADSLALLLLIQVAD